MPVVLLALLRPFVMWLVTIGVTTVVANAVAGILKAIVDQVRFYYNIPEGDGKVVVLNQLIDLAALLGVGTGVLYTKLGVKAADYIGLKAVGNVKKTLSAGSSKAVAATDALPNAKARAGGFMAAITKGETIWRVVIVGMILQQVGDWFIFGRPQLQGYLDAIFGKDVVDLPRATDAPPGFSNATWEAYYLGLEQAGIVGIEGGAVQATTLYSRDALTQLIWWGYSQLLKDGVSATETAIKKKIQPTLRFKGTAPTSAAAPSPTSSSTTFGAASGVGVPQEIKVYTGVIANGTLGTPSEFISRPDDLIQSAEELKQSAKNNLAAFVQSLPGNFYYEIGIVNSIKTRSGFTQKGEPVRVVTGYYKSGLPRYKTIYYKFAVMKLGVYDENRRTVKLGTINLGPVNVVDYQPSTGQLSDIAAQITPELFTTDIGDVKSVTSPNPVSTTQTAAPPPVVAAPSATSAAGEATAAPAPVAQGGKSLFKVNTQGSNLNVRNGHSLTAAIIGKLPDGQIVRVSNSAQQFNQDGYEWYQLDDPFSGGWVASQYLVQVAAPAPAPAPTSSSTSTKSTGPTTTSTKSTTDSLGLTPNQRKTYDNLIKVGASKSAALTAAKLVPK